MLVRFPQFWHNGTVGYEEMLLPIACKYSDNCNLGTFDDATSVSADGVLFRPIWPCLFFLKALSRPSPSRREWGAQPHKHTFANHQVKSA